jgi:putative hydrolase of the HAD superfamily
MLLFDLDNTLYSSGLGVVPRIDRRINEYMAARLGIAHLEVDAMRREFWAEHGTTLRGLMTRYRVDPDDYLRYVHEIEIDDLIAPDAELRRELDRLPVTKAIFSNACRSHAWKVLDRLGIAECFQAVVVLEDLGYVPKPMPEAYRTVLDLVGAPAERCSLIDDMLPNLIPAKKLGMRTIWVSDSAGAEGADAVIPRIHAIAAVLP